MGETSVILVIIGMMAVTYPPRVLPALLLASRQLPDVVETWLGYIPVAVLSALLFPDLLLKDHRLYFSVGNVYLLAAIPTFLVAWKTKNLFTPVFTGMVIVVLLRLLVG